MNKSFCPHPGYQPLQSTLTAISRWLRSYWKGRASIRELQSCTKEDLAGMARELGMSSRELLILAQTGPAELTHLNRLLAALGIDSQKLEDPLIMRDLQRLCTTCRYKRQCESDLLNGKAQSNFGDYCPNAFTLDTLLADADVKTKRDIRLFAQQ
jgi:hypothetical protein